MQIKRGVLYTLIIHPKILLKQIIKTFLKYELPGGVTFYTNSTCSTGGYLSPGGSAWQYVSDSTKKENFLDANGEYFLESISKMKLGSWQYKSQNNSDIRHYGPMAQEVFQYFGKDALGIIGCDTLLNSGDINGIMMIGIQALEKRSADAKEKIAELDRQNKELKQTIENLQNANTALKAEKDYEIEGLQTTPRNTGSTGEKYIKYDCRRKSKRTEITVPECRNLSGKLITKKTLKVNS